MLQGLADRALDIGTERGTAVTRRGWRIAACLHMAKGVFISGGWRDRQCRPMQSEDGALHEQREHAEHRGRVSESAAA
jgi:hypothetical protein